jgi:sec-independent protein translocase protein TatC
LTNLEVSSLIKNQIDINSYIGLVKTTSLACGLVFELPIIIYFLSIMGLVSPQFLREYRKYAIVLILILAAVITPPDVISQIIVSIPLLILYEISIYISKFVQKKTSLDEKNSTGITNS